MDTSLINNVIGDTDIYLIDQILKGRYKEHETILDAGCGIGRNMHWFLKNQLCIYGVDSNVTYITELKMDYADLPPIRLQVADIEQMPFGDNFFNHIISSAVLHFAESTQHFFNIMSEMFRVLKPNGTLFIRMTSNIGIEHLVKKLKNGVYILPDGTSRFLLTRDILKQLLHQFPFTFMEPLKTVNVDDMRCMSTLLLHKTIIKK
ncbi:MAG: class I SAM-dependent methyltransferase [Chitinophagaceae bacterium]|nr:class I SAM-dependent methyltransferase [Chitinophagaceae bacterium]